MELDKTRLALALIVIFHLVLGAYAVYDGGFFVYGVTAPERMTYHAVTGASSHITLSGALKHVASDVCLQDCGTCSMHCYVPETLTVDCVSGCTLKAGDEALADEGQEFAYIMKNALLYPDAVFACFEDNCGFTTPIDENRTYFTHLPESVTYLR